MVDCIIVGPYNVVIYKDIFPYIKDRVLRLGYTTIPEFNDGIKFGNINWYSTIGGPVPEKLCLNRVFDSSYEKYDHYDAINVDRIEDIPADYTGEIGVPITFLEKWNADQFDVVAKILHNGGGYDVSTPFVNGIKKYARIVIKKR